MRKNPNILLIHADQHRYDCLGAYGNTDIKTPNIDRLARDGVLFANSFCPHPVCTPSRYSLLTSLYIHQHLGLTNESTLPRGIPTLPRMLNEGGYTTAAVGKMHFTPTYLDVGFDILCVLLLECPDQQASKRTFGADTVEDSLCLSPGINKSFLPEDFQVA